MNPYLTDAARVERILAAARRGAAVRVVLAEHANSAVAAAAGHRYRDLLAAGIQIWELPNVVVHAKVAVADDVASLGTVNLDALVLYRNREIALPAPQRATRSARLGAAVRAGHRPQSAEPPAGGTRIAVRLAHGLRYYLCARWRSSRMWNASSRSPTPWKSDQMPANTSSTYCLCTKNRPLVQNATITMATPARRPNHQNWLWPRSSSACSSQNTPTTRNRNPRMSATPANVASGSISETTPAKSNSRPEHPVDPAPRAMVQAAEEQSLHSGDEEHEPDHGPDGADRGLVELEHDQRGDDPEDAAYEPQPPQIGAPAERVRRHGLDRDRHGPIMTGTAQVA